MFKDIFPILICLSNHKNSDIAQKIYDLNQLIKKKIIAEVFESNIDWKNEQYTYKYIKINQNSEIKNACLKENNNNLSNKSITKTNMNSLKEKLNNINIKSKENDDYINDHTSENKFFDKKIEEMKKLILKELSETDLKNNIPILKNKDSSNITSNETNKNAINVLRNIGTGKLNEKSISNNFEIEKINSFDNSINYTKSMNEKKIEKLKLNRNSLNLSNNNNSINNKINEKNKIGFYNIKDENKKELKKENMFICEKGIIENSNLLLTETFNIDSSIISLKENNSLSLNFGYHNTRLRSNSNLENREKNINKDGVKRTDSIKGKGT